MRNLKKVLALVIAFSMMLSVVAFASYPDVAADADYADAVELLSALNIIKGDDLGNFNPDNTITRAEFAAVVCRALGLENSATGAAGATAFADVAADHWASGYINLATQNGIINGYGDGRFGPEDKVTYEQAVKMLVCALGFEPMAAQKGGYPTGYLVVANTYKITAGVTATVEAPRKTVAKLVYNALSTPKMDQTSYGVNAEWEVLDGRNDREYATLLTDMDIFIISGIVGAKDVEEDTVALAVKESSKDYEFGSEYDGADKRDYVNYYAKGDTETLNINGSNISSYETQYVDVYVEKNGRGDYYVLAVVPSTMGETLTIVSDDVKEVSGNKVEYYVDGSSKTKTIKVDTSNVVYSKNKNVDAEFVVANLDPDSENYIGDDIELTFVENTGDSSFDMIIATEYTSVRVTDVDEGRIKLGKYWLEPDEDKDNVEYLFVDAKGAELELEDFAKDDVVAYITNDEDDDFDKATYIRLVKLTDNAITGVVTETATQSGKDYVWISGEKYETLFDLKNEDEGTFFISLTGKIFDFEGTSSVGNYAYLLEAAKASNKTFSKDVWEIKVLTADGGVAEYTLTEDATADFDAYIVTADFDLDEDGAWLFADNAADLNNEYRLITFKTNSKGEIKSFEAADDEDAEIVDVDKTEYNAKTQKINGKLIEDDTVIFDVTGSKAESAFATDISYLVDESSYGGKAIKVDGEIVLFLVTVGDAKLSNETGFAIVTEKKETTVDGEDLVIIDYIQDMEAGQITFNDDSTVVTGTKEIKAEDLDIGDVIMFNASADGIVNTYAVLAQISGNYLKVYEETLNVFDEENEFIYGYIASEDGGKSSKYDTVTVGGVEAYTGDISVGADANTYSYYNAGRNLEIKTRYITEDAKWYKDANKAEDDEATVFFARLVDETVVDIYTFNTRIEGETAINAFEGAYVKGTSGAVVEEEEEEEEEVEEAGIIEEAIVEEIEKVVID